MGILIDGIWHTDEEGRANERGRFIRSESAFRHWVTADGGPGPDGVGGFAAEPGRYHLYVALSCPWAHRTLIVRKLKRLDRIIPVSVVEPAVGEQGWFFCAPDREPTPGSTRDPVHGAHYLYEVYTAADSAYTGRVTVPVLWDLKQRTIVNNESSEIIRMFNRAFDEWGDATLDLYPPALRDEIDRLNAVIYQNVNNGVYRCGFATTQEAYEEAFDALFATLDELEARLARQRYLVGGRLTEADWRLFPTLVRFDAAYYGNFKCNLRRLSDYPNLWNYTRELYQVPGVAETVSLLQIKRTYYSIARVNPTRIVPKGPVIDFAAPHDRARLPAA